MAVLIHLICALVIAGALVHPAEAAGVLWVIAAVVAVIVVLGAVLEDDR